MPTYEYQCRGCNEYFEIFQNITDPVKRKCPKCGKLQLKRLISAGAGVIFKGSGFYETDYKRSNCSISKKNKMNENSESQKVMPDKSKSISNTGQGKSKVNCSDKKND